jgi:S1-C subfamily serine protease
VQETDRLVPTGTALNWTTDGWFMTVAGSLPEPGKTYVLVLYNGDVVPVTAATTDTRSSLVLLKTNAKNVAISSLANTADTEVGQKLVIANATGRAGDASFGQTALQTKEQLSYGVTASADATARGFGITSNAALQPGSVLATTNGDALGLWDGGRVIPASYMKVVAMVMGNGGNKIRFGFSYRFVETAEVKALGVVSGARVMQIDDKKAVAATSGLQVGDIITAVDTTKILQNTDLETALEQLTTGTTSVWQINRAGQTLSLSIRL